MIYLLDTDSVVFVIRALKNRGGAGVRRKAERLVGQIASQQAAGHSVGISAITRAELEYGTGRSLDTAKERAALEKILLPFDEYDFDAGLCARRYGTIRGALEEKGLMIGAMDVLIAAHAMALEAVLVTNNTRHFRRVQGLAVENWST